MYYFGVQLNNIIKKINITVYMELKSTKFTCEKRIVFENLGIIYDAKENGLLSFAV
jgi:hypothetical protein